MKFAFTNFRNYINEHPIGFFWTILISVLGLIGTTWGFLNSHCDLAIVPKNYVSREVYNKVLMENVELKLLPEKRNIEHQKMINDQILSVSKELKDQINEMRAYSSTTVIFSNGKESPKEVNTDTEYFKIMDDNRKMLMEIRKKLTDKL